MADQDRRRHLGKAKKLAKENQKANKPDEESNNKTELGLIGGIMFGLFALLSIGADILPIVTGGLSFFVDILISFCLWIFGIFTILLITGDPMKALIGRRASLNLLKSGLEFFPIIAFLPIHTFVIIVLWFDFKYNILDFSKGVSKLTNT